MAQTTKKGTLTGVKNFHYAILTKDDKTGVEYDTPVSVAAVKEVNIKSGASQEVMYGDDAPYDTANYINDAEVTVNLAQLPLEDYAKLLGHTVDKGVVDVKADDTPPLVAIAFESTKTTGAKRYFKILKCRFSEPDDDYKGKESNAGFNTPSITAKVLSREYDGKYKRMADSDAEGFEETTATKWYESIEPVGG